VLFLDSFARSVASAKKSKRRKGVKRDRPKVLLNFTSPLIMGWWRKRRSRYSLGKICLISTHAMKFSLPFFVLEQKHSRNYDARSRIALDLTFYSDNEMPLPPSTTLLTFVLYFPEPKPIMCTQQYSLKIHSLALPVYSSQSMLLLIIDRLVCEQLADYSFSSNFTCACFMSQFAVVFLLRLTDIFTHHNLMIIKPRVH